MQTPLISIIMPAFNAEATIETAIDSVLAQTYPRFELFICDDASSDRTTNIIAGYPNEKIVMIRNPFNLGQGLSRDRAIGHASGELIAFLDADDAWAPQRLEVLIGALGGRTDAMVFDNIMLCTEIGRGLAPWKPLRSKRMWSSEYCSWKAIGVRELVRARSLLMQPLIPRFVIEENQIKHRGKEFGEDAEFIIECIAFGLEIIYVPEPLYFYRLSSRSASSEPDSACHMRMRLERCRGLFEGNVEIEQAFRKKLEQLRNIEIREMILRQMRKGAIIKAILLMIKNPVAALNGLMRIPSYLSYRLRGRGRCPQSGSEM